MTLVQKPFVIQVAETALELEIRGLSASRHPEYLMAVRRKRIVRTRWFNNARGFATLEEAKVVVEQLRLTCWRLDFTVQKRVGFYVGASRCTGGTK